MNSNKLMNYNAELNICRRTLLNFTLALEKTFNSKDLSYVKITLLKNELENTFEVLYKYVINPLGVVDLEPFKKYEYQRSELNVDIVFTKIAHLYILLKKIYKEKEEPTKNLVYINKMEDDFGSTLKELYCQGRKNLK